MAKGAKKAPILDDKFMRECAYGTYDLGFRYWGLESRLQAPSFAKIPL